MEIKKSFPKFAKKLRIMFYKDSKRLKNIELAIRHLQCCCKNGGGGDVLWENITGNQGSVNISGFNNDAGYITSADIPTPTLDEVLAEGNTGVSKNIILSTSDVSDSFTGNFVTSSLGDVNAWSSFITGYNMTVGEAPAETYGVVNSSIITGQNGTVGSNVWYSIISGYQSTIGATGYNINQRGISSSLQIGRRNNMYAAHGSAQIGGALISGSAFTTIVGLANEDITSTIASNQTPTYNAPNPRFVVGTGSWNVVNNTGTRRNGFVVWSNGEIRMPQYGSGNFTGTPTYNLAVDSSGKVIEVATGGSFNLTVTDDDAVTASNIDTINFVGATVTDNLDGTVDVIVTQTTQTVKQVKVTVAGNDLKNCSSNPVTIIPAQGARTVINILSATAYLDYGSEAYSFAGDVYLRIGNNPSFTLDEAELNVMDNNYMIFFAPTQSSSSANNSAVVLTSGSDSATGDSTVTIVVTYTVDDYS